MSRSSDLIRPPAEVERIARKLEKAGYETWCVGGGVRDALLGEASLDWDLATAATPDVVRKLFRRTIPVGERFGTVAIIDRNNVKHEVTTFRRDVETDGRHAVVQFGASLDDDLARRDLTINAIAYSVVKRRLHDPFDGRGDLRRGIIRAVGEPIERMREDRLRALRAIRFAARYEFHIERSTWEAIVASGPFLTRLSAERVRQEIEKTMEQVRCPGLAFRLWRDGGAFGALVPSLGHIGSTELGTLDALPQPRQAGPSRRRMLRLVALFAFATKPPAGLLRDLRFSNADVRWISDCVQRWRSLHQEMTITLLTPEGPDDAIIRRWAASAGRTRIPYVLRLAAARWTAERGEGATVPAAARVASVYRRAIRIAYRDPIEIADLAIDGTDLERLGLKGPAVGRALDELLRTVVRDPSANDPATLTELATRLSLTAGS